SHLSFYSYSGDHRDLHSFPTRRSSDLCAEHRQEARLASAQALRDEDDHEPWTVARSKKRPAKSGASAGQTASVFAGRFLDLATRSEEHTSELQSQSNLVCRLLLEKKKK